MALDIWYVDFDFVTSHKIPEAAGFDILDLLDKYQGVLSLSHDGKEGSITLSVGAHNINDASDNAHQAWGKLKESLYGATITKMQITSESKRISEAEELTIPELVGYAEIANMAHVSRQRARELASQESFPVPVVETAAGPLRIKTAVENWLSNWDRAPGRPRRNKAKQYQSA